MTETKTFHLSAEHVTLLRHMLVGWQDCETGAPEIDPKRPYGNSNVASDVAEILEIEGWDPFGDDEMSDELEQRMLTLHRETETALQVVLAVGSFETGDFTCEPYSAKWQRV